MRHHDTGCGERVTEDSGVVTPRKTESKDSKMFDTKPTPQCQAERRPTRFAFWFSLAAICWCGLALGVATPEAKAQDPYEAVENLDLNGYWIESGADGDLGAYSDLARDARQTDQTWFFVTLASPAENGNSIFADDVYGLTEKEGTVVVVSPTDGGYDVAVVSSPRSFDSDQIDTALDQAAATLSGTDGEAIDRHRAVFDALSAQPTKTDNGSSSALPAMVALGAVTVGGGIWWTRRKNASRAKAQDAAEIETARSEIRAQLDAVANYVIDIGDRIDVSGNEQAETYYREATNTFTEVDHKLAEATSLVELADLDDDIELARWKMEAAEALAENRQVPKRPEPDEPAECFFDPTHRLGTVDAVVTTPAGSKTVQVCQQCADKLERGEQPRPRLINVGGQSVPAARAPRSHGGLGMGGIDIFDIILGSAVMNQTRRRGARTTGSPRSQRPTYDWGPPRTKSRRRGGVFGPDRTPRSNPNRRASGSRSRRSSTRRPSSRRRSSARGSGRRIM